MDFTLKKENFIDNYNNIKHIIKKAIKNNNNIVTGSGGSNNIIIINEEFIIKIIPNIKYPILKKKPNNDFLEADFYKLLTDQFINKDRTPHIVGIYKRYLIEDIKFIFPSKCLTLDEKIMTPFSKKTNNNSLDKLCYLKNGYNKKLVEKKASILILENCPTTISNRLGIILKKSNKIEDKIKLFNIFIKRVIFQFMFTLALIQKDYPDFIHNDMFLRNILAINEINYEPTDYVQYNFNSKSYYLPANGIYIKINDFGYSLNLFKNNSTLEDNIKSSINNSFEINNPYRDVYTFLFDLYDGPGLGELSAKTIILQSIKNKLYQKLFMKNLKREIGKFFNYKLIDKINSINYGILDWTWNISESKNLMNSVKKPADYFKDGSFDFLMKIPLDGVIVKIYN